MLKKIVVLALLLLGSIPCIASAASSATFKLPATGQTTCYDTNGNVISCAGTGQDAVYHINPMSFTDNGDGTVTDNNTGLMWQQQENPASYNWYQATGTYDGTSNNTTPPVNVCGTLNLPSTTSYTDWRLPTEKELMSIVDYSIPYSGPTLNTNYFPNAHSDFYWAISPVANNNGNAWSVDFGFGDVGYAAETTTYYVRCVRSGISAPTPRFTSNSDGTTTDNYTGLMWQQSPASAAVSWSSALSYCQGLSLGNSSYTDWRLPNVKELESITDDTKSGLVVDTDYFPGAQSAVYWSSTTVTPNFDGYNSDAWTVNFNDGSVYYLGNKIASSPSNVAMCVRGGQPILNDFNKDGNTDILWRNTSSGDVAVWFLNGTTTTGTAIIGNAPYPTWQIAGTGFFNNDGNTDILWRNTSSGDVAVWFLNGTTVTGTATIGNAPYPTWQIAGTGDFNHDGKTDILWRNTSSGDVAVWFLNGTTVTGTAIIGNAPYPTWQIAGTGDFNQDGQTDILWRNTSTGLVATWFLNGTTVTGTAVIGHDSPPYDTWQIAGTGDFTHDGKTDILWRNTSSGDIAVWFLNGTSEVSTAVIGTAPYNTWQISQ
jgi:hypothetical protein